MLARINRIADGNKTVMVTKLDIDDLGSIVVVRDLELSLPPDDDSIVQILRSSTYAAIFTDDMNEENGSTVILANGITVEALNIDKDKTVARANKFSNEL